MKINEPPSTNKIGSIRMTHEHATYNNVNGQYKTNTPIPKGSSKQHQELKETRKDEAKLVKPNNGHRLSFVIDDDDEIKLSRNNSQGSSRSKRLLKRTQEEELKFIDTSIESDLPPTLSSLQQRKLNPHSNPHTIIESHPSSPLTVTITNEQDNLESISQSVENNNQLTTNNNHLDVGVDSAVEESIISQDNQVN